MATFKKGDWVTWSKKARCKTGPYTVTYRGRIDSFFNHGVAFVRSDGGSYLTVNISRLRLLMAV